MSIDKRLNLIKGSPSFAFRELANGEMEVFQPASIPDDEHIYWVQATSRLPCGMEIPGVFVIKNGGSQVLKNYWWVENEWLESSDSRVLALLTLAKEVMCKRENRLCAR